MNTTGKPEKMDSLETLKKEYESNKGDYMKWIFLRFGIILSVVLAIYSGVNNMEKHQIKEQIDIIKQLARISGSVPESKDLFIQYIYLKPAADEVAESPVHKTHAAPDDTTRFGRYCRIFLRDSIYQARRVQAGTRSEDSLQKAEALTKDSLFIMIGNATTEQARIMANIENQSDKEFTVSFPFLNGSIDLRYAIFLIPLLFILSEIYFFLLRIKLFIVSSSLAGQYTDEKVFTLNFIRQPNLFLNNLVRFFELLLLAVFSKTIIIFSSSADILGVVVYLSGVIALIYYAVLFANLYAIEINRDEPLLENRRKTLIRLFRWSAEFIQAGVSKVNKTFSVSAGSALVIITLFVAITYQGCNNAPVKGYEFISSYKALRFAPTWWVMGGETTIKNSSLGSLTGTHAYFAGLLISLVTLFLVISARVDPGKEQKFQKWYRRLLLISGSCFLIFAFLFSFVGSVLIISIPFFDLALVALWIFFIQKKNSGITNEEWLIEKIKIIAFSWPLLFTNFFYFTILPISKTYGQLFLYLGLLLLVTGLYKYSSTVPAKSGQSLQGKEN